MSLFTVSTKRNRAYQRKFDHEECQRLRLSGWTYRALADHYKVSYAAIQRILNPDARQRMAETSKQWLSDHKCSICGARCTHNPSTLKARGLDPNSPPRCKACYLEIMRATKRRNREDHLIKRHDDHGNILCTNCQEHKPPTSFQFDEDGFPSRYLCRECRTSTRRARKHHTPLQTPRHRRYTQPSIRRGYDEIPAPPTRTVGRTTLDVPPQPPNEAAF